MNSQQLNDFYVIGIAVRTSNEKGKAEQDIPALWHRFMSEDMIARIPNKIDDTVYCIYTDYETDHTQPYTTLLGCKVSRVDEIPEGMVMKLIQGGSYVLRQAQGNLMEGVVLSEWIKIWNAQLPRKYTNDFEVYGEKTTNPEQAEVDIYIAIK